MRQAIISILRGLILAYLIFTVFVFFNQSNMLYAPQIQRDSYTFPLERGMAYESLTLATPDGEKLDAWYIPSKETALGVVLFTHGNAGNISQRMDSIEMFHKLGYSVLIFDYRGYGRSSGKPTEPGLHVDTETAWDYLVTKQKVSPKDIVLFGESLGGALAAHLASNHSARALVLSSAFLSVPELANDTYPWLPINLIARLSYDTKAAVAKAKCPVLIAHSPDDTLIAFHHGQHLFETAPEPKSFLTLAGGHNEGLIFARSIWVNALSDFLSKHSPKTGTNLE